MERCTKICIHHAFDLFELQMNINNDIGILSFTHRLNILHSGNNVLVQDLMELVEHCNSFIDWQMNQNIQVNEMQLQSLRTHICSLITCNSNWIAAINCNANNEMLIVLVLYIHLCDICWNNMQLAGFLCNMVASE